MGENIESALKRSKPDPLTLHSYDMLGEAALCAEDVEHYHWAYSQAIEAISKTVTETDDLFARPGISVKLSALHPRYEFAQRERVLSEMTPLLLKLAQQAKSAGISMTLDAEESERLELSLEIFETVYTEPSLEGWGGLGLAVQAYQKRATAVLDWLVALARHHGRMMPVRLVKGAYWDSEIKRAQQLGLEGYPVFTRKQNSDISYLACAQRLLAAKDVIYSQFATHNARTMASICVMAGDERHFEFQRLHGMGEGLVEQLHESRLEIPVRIYAPVGSYEALLPYLVRRLLENGANSSFINRIWDDAQTVEQILADPIGQLEGLESIPHHRIPLPVAIYGPQRLNSSGVNLTDTTEVSVLNATIANVMQQSFQAAPLIAGKPHDGETSAVINPAQSDQRVGEVVSGDEETARHALDVAAGSFRDWSSQPIEVRALALWRMADLLEEQQPMLLGLMIREAGKSIPDAVAELREAVDFCRYYAQQIREHFDHPMKMPGPTGEQNELHWAGRGVFVCISPWNFPLAIFTGQIAAALAAGNSVIAKPAHQTPLIAWQVIKLFHQAGVPEAVVNLLPCSGSMLSRVVLSDLRVAGVVFTGSTDTAWKINQTLAQRKGAIIPFIAETGGQNAMIVDSSALPEQVVRDVVRSAFNSAGQRCSALRVLFVQKDIASRVIELLKGAMAELRLGDTHDLATDIGPVIDEEAYDKLMIHAEQFADHDKLLYQCPLDGLPSQGYFVPPTLLKLDHLSELPHEVFGPMLHVIEYDAAKLNEVIESINNTGYGLTLGIHSRIENTIETVLSRVHVGNIYVNRDMIGAVVGTQPFGGEGLSGTGFKAGGPHYLYRFATERTISINSSAMGGNAQLLTLKDSD
jgi:RHH-type proline utilization regulon transcriptional repressor/proline dehydrogenase/delta 1-pyrroline-5-carboxylate dehydrogenase